MRLPHQRRRHLANGEGWSFDEVEPRAIGEDWTKLQPPILVIWVEPKTFGTGNGLMSRYVRTAAMRMALPAKTRCHLSHRRGGRIGSVPSRLTGGSTTAAASGKTPCRGTASFSASGGVSTGTINRYPRRARVSTNFGSSAESPSAKRSLRIAALILFSNSTMVSSGHSPF